MVYAKDETTQSNCATISAGPSHGDSPNMSHVQTVTARFARAQHPRRRLDRCSITAPRFVSLRSRQQHFLYFFHELHGHGSFRPVWEAACHGVGALFLRTMASPFYGGAVMLATAHIGS